MGKMADNIDLLAGKIAELADKASGPGMQAALEAARMEAYSCLAGATAGMVFAGIVGITAAKLWKRGKAWTGNSYDTNFWFVSACCLFGLAALMVFINSWAFIDPRTWVTLSHPEYWLAKRMLGI